MRKLHLNRAGSLSTVLPALLLLLTQRRRPGESSVEHAPCRNCLGELIAPGPKHTLGHYYPPRALPGLHNRIHHLNSSCVFNKRLQHPPIEPMYPISEAATLPLLYQRSRADRVIGLCLPIYLPPGGHPTSGLRVLYQ